VQHTQNPPRQYSLEWFLAVVWNSSPLFDLNPLIGIADDPVTIPYGHYPTTFSATKHLFSHPIQKSASPLLLELASGLTSSIFHHHDRLVVG
jgi:hypothetical protein